MKKSTLTKLLILGLLIVGITACSFAQNGFDTNQLKTRKQIKELYVKTIKLDLQITIDSKVIEDSIFNIEILNTNTNLKSNIKTSNKFILYLDFDNEFYITFSYKNSNKKTIIINTLSPYEDWYIISGINLNSNNKENTIVGGIKYNSKIQTFEKYKL